MFRNIFWMGLSNVVRLGTNLLLIILIARHLGPEEFGHYMFWYGTNILFARFVSYGLNSMLLKEVAQQPESVANTLSESLSLRLLLSGCVFLCALGCSTLVDRPELLLTLLAAHLVEVISETLYVAYRALGHYARESQLATLAGIIQLGFVAVAVITKQNAAIIAVAFLAGKVAQFVLILPISKRTFGRFSLQPAATTFQLAWRAKAYAIDHLLATAFGNIDSAILRIFVSIDAVGIYQSGMRIFQGLAQAAGILSNVFLPELARQALCEEKNPRIVLSLQVSFLIYGLIVGLTLAYFSDQIVDLAFGERYNELTTLLPFFGLLFFVRFLADAWGVILIANGHQAYRAKAAAIHWIFALLLGSFLTYDLKAQGWIIALILASLLLGALYAIRIIRAKIKASITINIGIAIIGGVLFIPRLI